MLLYLLISNILLTPAIFCNDSDVSKSKTSTIESSIEKLSNTSSTTKVALPSEGGSILPDVIGLSLPHENKTIPVNIDVGKNKVVARKGVNYTEEATKSQEKPLSSSNENTTNKVSTSGEKPNTLNKHPEIPKQVLSTPKINSLVTNKTVNSTNEVKTPKKPLTLEAEVLENMTPKSSEVFPSDQPQSSLNKSFITNPDGPGMVMPIVITILLVPMFAVLGFMALRRGQEAWKNRHYKRMDFLLDGMYND